MARRRFDHDEAARRHTAGESYASLAADYGVNEQAVYQAVKRITDPAWAVRDNAYHRDLQRSKRRTACAGDGCDRLVWTHTPGSSGLCPRCFGLARSHTIRADMLLCTTCGEWKHDEAFPNGRNRKGRRGRHATCRACQAAVKRAYRDARKVPCVTCGQPCYPPGKERRTPADTPPVYRACYIASITKH